MHAATEDYALKMDAQDPLRGFRERFHIPPGPGGKPCLYFCGNSLGLQPRTTRDMINAVIDDWKNRGVDAHFEGDNPWTHYHEKLLRLSVPIVGAADESEIAVMNALTTNIHLMMVSFYRPTATRYKIIMEDNAFPSDIYAIKSQIAFHGYDPDNSVILLKPRPGEHLLRHEDILETIGTRGKEAALLLMGGLHYYTGQLFDIKAITAAAQAQGCVAGFDLAHAAGNVPLKLHEWNVDFACWCAYKYLNSGPGGIAGCFVHERHLRRTDLPRFAGWWGNNLETRFDMKPDFDAPPNALAWQVSNPSVVSLAGVRAALEIFEEAGMTELRRKSLSLTGYLEFLLDDIKSDAFTIMTPRDPAQRGCQLSLLMHRNGKAVFDALVAGGVICDWRNPDCIRMAPVPLYNGYHDVYNFVSIFRNALNAAPQIKKAV